MRAKNSGLVVAALVVVGAGAWSAGCSSSSGGKKSDDSTLGTGGSAAAVGSGGAAPGSGGAGATAMMGASGSGSGGHTGSGGAGASGGGGAGGASAMPMMDAGMTDGGGDAAVGEPPCEMKIPSSMDCGAPLAPGDERTCMLGDREYIVHAGKSMNACKPVALVIDAHGATETDKQQLGKEQFCTGTLCWMGLGSGWAAESDMPGGGFIAVFPQGINNMWSDTDADFMVNIVTEMKKLADIDPNKVYISGISNGGFLTFWTGCTHPDVFRGMAPHSGGADCTMLSKPTPLIAFDAMADFAYDSDVSATNTVVSLNHCKGDAKPWITIDATYQEAVCRTAKQDMNAKLVPCSEVMGATIMPTTCKIWDDCDEGVKVAFCEVAPNTDHGADNAATDAHIIYENNTILNTPSVAWRFFKMFW